MFDVLVVILFLFQQCHSEIPVLESFDLDMRFGTITFVYEKLVKVDTLDATKISFQNTHNVTNETVSFRLTGLFESSSYLTNLGNQSSFSFHMLPADYASISYETKLAKAQESSYIALDAGAISSAWGEENVEINATNATKVTNYIADSIPPAINSFQVNMNTGEINMTMNEPIDTSTFRSYGLAFQDRQNAYVGGTYIMASSSSSANVTASYDLNRKFTFVLGTDDMRAIKQAGTLFLTAATTYMSAWQSIINDTAGVPNSNSGFDIFVGKLTSSFIPDTTRPTLLYWGLDLNNGKIDLQFSEVIDIQSFNFSAMVLRTHVGDDADLFTMRVIDPINVLTQFDADTLNSDFINVSLTQSQVNLINTVFLFQSGVEYAYLYIGNGACTDVSEVGNLFSGTGVPIQAAYVTPDTTMPVLMSFDINMTSQVMDLTFSKVINISTLALDQLILQSQKSVSASTLSVLFSNEIAVVQPYDTTQLVVSLKLTSYGFSKIKGLMTLAHRQATSYLAVTTKFVTDLALSKNSIVAVTAANALLATDYYPDHIPPVLDSWIMDASLDVLNLTFSEPVDVDTFIITDMSLRTAVEDIDSTIIITFTDTSYISGYYLTNVYIKMGLVDVTAYKKQSPLCTSGITCFLQHTSALVKDVATYNNSGSMVQNAALVPRYPTNPSRFINDTAPPYLLSYSMDINDGVLSMQFSEPVKNPLLNTHNIIVYGDVEQVNSWRFSAHCFADGIADSLIDMKMSRHDFTGMKSQYLATSILNLYLYLGDNTAVDMQNNSMVATELVDGLYMTATEFTSDITPPEIAAFTYSSINKTATVRFTDAVVVGAATTNNMILISSDSKTILLNQAALLYQDNSGEMVFDISPIYDDALLLNMFDNQDDTNIYIDKFSAVTDVSLIAILPISPLAPIRAGNRILAFRLDLTNKKLFLEMAFNIVIDTLTTTYFVLHSSGYSVQYELTGYRYFNVSDDGFVVDITMTEDDYIGILKVLPIDSAAYLYMQTDYRAIVDDVGLNLGGSQDLQAAGFRPDVTPPELLSFKFDPSTGFMVLEFSKPIKISSILIDQLTFVDSVSENHTAVTLSQTSFVTEVLGRTWAITATFDVNAGTYPTDMDLMFLTQKVGVDAASTNLVIGKGFLSDTALPPNFLPEALVANAVPVTEYVADTTPPVLESFDLDMSLRTLTLYFDTAVNRSTNIVTRYQFIADPNDIHSPQYTLTDSSYTYFPSDSVVDTTGTTMVIVLSSFDVEQIMLQAPNLVTKESNTFLATTAGGVVSDLAPAKNLMEHLLFRFALPVSNFVPDTVQPNLIQFNLTIANALLDIEFDEVMNCAKTRVDLLVFQYVAFVGTGSEQMMLQNSSSYVICAAQYSTHIQIKLGAQDVLRFQSFSLLLKTADSTFLRPTPNAFFDVYGNSVKEIFDGRALKVTKFVSDTTSPKLLSFTVTSQKIIVLTFSEPVATTSLVVSGLVFQNDISAPDYSFSLVSSKFYRATKLNMVIQISLLGDYNTIVGGSRVFLDQDKTFLRATNLTIKDTSGNALTAVRSTSALALGPAIIAFSLNMNTGALLVTFSEAVDQSFSSVGITLQRNGTTNESSVALTTTTLFTVSTVSTDAENSYSVVLSSDDINNMKYLGVGDNEATSFLSVSFGLTFSLSSATIIPYLYSVAIESNAALQASAHVFDTTPPLCTSFNLDLNLGLLELEFNEPVDLNNLVVSYISIVGSTTGATVPLTFSDALELTTVTTLRLNITFDDLNNIKLKNRKGPMDRVLLKPNAVTDLNGNWIAGNLQANPVVRSQYIPDTTPPSLSKADLDLSTNLLSLSFDEVIDIKSLFPFNIYVLGQDSFGGVEYALTNFSIIEASSGSEILVDMNTYVKDAFGVRSTADLGTSTANTFIGIVGARDIAGNEMDASSTFQASSVTVDTHAAVVQSFSLIYDNVAHFNFTINMDKYMDISNFHCSDFILMSNYTDTSDGVVVVALTDANCEYLFNPDGVTTMRQLTYQIPVGDLASTPAIISDPEGSTYNTFLKTVDSPVSIDQFGITIAATSAVVGNLNTRTAMGPQIVNYVLNLEVGRVTLVFSEPIDRDTFDASKLGFYSGETEVSQHLNSTDTPLDPFQVDSPTVDSIGVVHFSDSDLIALKLIDLSVSTNVFLLAGFGLTKNALGLSTVELTRYDLKTPARYEADISVPLLLNITLHMGLEWLILDFDEPIRQDSVTITNLIIQGDVTQVASNMKTLTGGKVRFAKSSLIVEFTRDDGAAIKLLPGMAKSINTSYLAFDFGTMFDMAGNGLLPIETTNARMVDHYVYDNIDPELESFTLDMDVGLLTMYFSEPVNVTTMDLTVLTIQNRFTSDEHGRYTLLETVAISPDGSVVEAQLSSTDIYNIKSVDDLARSRQTSYVVFPSSFVKDLTENSITEIINGVALPCLEFSADVQSPYVVSYIMDYDAFECILTFSELVMLPSVDVRALTFQQYNVVPVLGYKSFTLTLSSGEYRTSNKILFNQTVTVRISTPDMNSIKYLTPLALEQNSTFIAMENYFLTDTFGNPAVPILQGNGLRVTEYRGDTIQPTLVEYILDMNKGRLLLSFSETVNPSSFDDTQITIQTTKRKRFGKALNLQDSVLEFEKMDLAGELTLTMSDYTYNSLKFYGLATTAFNSYMSYTDKLVFDYAGNNLPPLWDGAVMGYSPRQPDTYVADTTSPALSRWYVDRDNYFIHMLFTEPVTILNSTAFLFSNSTTTIDRAKRFRISVKNMEYRDLNMEVLIEVNPMCVAYGMINSTEVDIYGNVTVTSEYGCSKYVSFKDFFTNWTYSMYLSLPSSSIEDFAKNPIPITPITYAFGLQISGPGKLLFFFLLLYCGLLHIYVLMYLYRLLALSSWSIYKQKVQLIH